MDGLQTLVTPRGQFNSPTEFDFTNARTEDDEDQAASWECRGGGSEEWVIWGCP